MLRAKSLQSCPFLCDPMDCSPPGFSVYGIFQARILEGVAKPSSSGPSRPRDRTWVSCLQVNSLPLGSWESPVRRIHMTIQCISRHLNTHTQSTENREGEVAKEGRSTFSAASGLHVVCVPSAEERSGEQVSSVTRTPRVRVRARAECLRGVSEVEQKPRELPSPRPGIQRVRGRGALRAPLGAGSPPCTCSVQTLMMHVFQKQK